MTETSGPTASPRDDEGVTLSKSATLGTAGQDADWGDQNQSAIADAEQNVPVEWKKGDVIVDTYEVKGELGEGGFGKVYKVHHKGWNVDMAVKSARAHVREEDIVREAEVWMELGLHPNIVSCHFVRKLGGIPRIFVEYVEGGTLHDWLYGKEPDRDDGEEAAAQPPRELTMAQRLGIAIEICRGMQHAHTFEWTSREGSKRVGLVHRDLKPANILMTPDGVPRVTDFGLVGLGVASDSRSAMGGSSSPAKPSAQDTDEITDGGKTLIMPRARRNIPTAREGATLPSMVGGVPGTPHYTPPEQWDPHAVTTEAADVYAFGVILYELFCGRRPFELPDRLKHAIDDVKATEFQRMHYEDVPSDPASFVEGLDEELSKLILQSMEKEPTRRPPGFAFLGKQLKECYARSVGRDYDEISPEPEATELLADSLNNRALSYRELGQQERAETLWAESLRVGPRHLEATYNELLVYWRTGRISDETVVKRLLAVADNDRRVWPLLALVHIERGDREEAESALARADGSDLHTKSAHAAILKANEMKRGWHTCAAELTAQSVKATAVVIAADGRVAVSGGSDQGIRVWDLEKGVLSRTCAGHRAPITALAMTLDGHLLASGSEDGVLCLWDLQRAQCRGVLEDAQVGSYHAESLQFIGGSGIIAAACSDGRLRLWSTQDSRLIHRIDGHAGRCNCVAASLDGRLMASGGTDLFVRVWEVATGAPMCKLSGHTTYVNGLTFIGGSTLLASVSGTIKKQDTDIRIWDTRRARQVAALVGHAGGLNHAVSSDDGRILLTCSGWGLFMNEESCIRVWDVHRQRCLRTLPGHGGATRGLALTPDGRHAVSGGDDSVVRHWSLACPWFEAPFAVSRPAATREASARDGDVQKQLRSVRVRLQGGDVSGARELVQGVRQVEGYERHPAALELWWAVLKQSHRCALTDAWCAHTMQLHPPGAIMHAMFLPKDGHAIALSAAGEMHTVDVTRGVCCRLKLGINEHLLRIAASQDGRLLAALTKQGTLLTARLDGTACVRRFGDLARGTGSLLVTADGTEVIAVNSDGLIRVWDAASKALRLEFQGIARSKCAYALSRDGRFLCEASRSRTSTLWDLSTGDVTGTWGGKPAECVALTPDGALAVTGDINGVVRVWDTMAGLELGAIGGHCGSVWCVSISPDGQLIASGGADGVVQLWNLPACERKNRLSGGHDNAVRCITWSRDSRYLLSTDDAGRLCVWELDWACRAASQTSEWASRLLPILRQKLGLHDDQLGIRPEFADALWTSTSDELADIGLGWVSKAEFANALARVAPMCKEKHQSPVSSVPIAEAIKQRMREIERQGNRAWAVRCTQCRQRTFANRPLRPSEVCRCTSCGAVVAGGGAVEEFVAATCACGVTTMCTDISDPVVCQQCGDVMFVVSADSGEMADKPTETHNTRAPSPSLGGTASRTTKPTKMEAQPSGTVVCASCNMQLPAAVAYCLFCGAQIPKRGASGAGSDQLSPTTTSASDIDPEIAELARKLVPPEKPRPGFFDRLQKMADEAKQQKGAGKKKRR